MIVLHAYSRKNSGDGLLVDLTAEVIKEAGLGKIDKIIALDKESFTEFENGYEPQIIKANLFNKGLFALKAVLNIFFANDLYENYLPPKSKEPVFAVGGGYMRGRTFLESIKTFLAQGPQLNWASRQKSSPVIYLPQSIGPFSGVMRTYIHSKLKKLDLICVRDDLSQKELNLPNVMRVPDLAVQELAMAYEPESTQTSFDKIYLIARNVNVPGNEEYIERLKTLKTLIPNIEPLIQSEGRGNDDVEFYKKLGWTGNIRKVKEVLNNPENRGVVISVRLHGSIQSMISGCPSIHLSYERKGFGAYSDLGIKEYCHGFKKFDPNLVLEQANQLKQNSTLFWQSINNNVKNVLNLRRVMIENIVETCSRYK
jgi:polysaccharide pyruvyl transferase WcaK-like protein